MAISRLHGIYDEPTVNPLGHQPAHDLPGIQGLDLRPTMYNSGQLHPTEFTHLEVLAEITVSSKPAAARFTHPLHADLSLLESDWPNRLPPVTSCHQNLR